MSDPTAPQAAPDAPGAPPAPPAAPAPAAPPAAPQAAPQPAEPPPKPPAPPAERKRIQWPAAKAKAAAGAPAVDPATLDAAKRWHAYAAAENARIEAEAATLPSYLQRALKAAANLEDRRAILDEYRASAAPAAPTPKPPVPTPAGGAASAAAVIDWSQRSTWSDQDFAANKARDPQGYAAYVDKLRRGKSLAFVVGGKK